MKISIDGKEVFSLTSNQKKVIQNDIKIEEFEEDIGRRIKWLLVDQKYKKCFERLKKEWEPRLKERGVKSVPLDEKEFSELVFSQHDYKSRMERTT